MRTSSTPKVVLHTPEPKGGAGRYVASLAMGLHRLGVPLTVFCPANFVYAPELQEAKVEMAFAHARKTSTAGLINRLGRNLGFLLGAIGTQSRIIRRGDLVHFQFPLHLPLGFLFYFAARLKGASLVLTAHDPLPHRWRLPRLFQFAERSMLGLSYRMCRTVVVHNQTGLNVMRHEFHIPANRVSLLPHGANIDAQPQSSCPDTGILQLLAFGMIRENKGLHLAIQAVKELRSQGSLSVRLTIAGSINTVAEADYWRYCRSLIESDAEGFEVIDRFIPDDQIPGLMARHHAMILPYGEFSSESGVAALALSHGMPLLATASGGLGELLDTAQCGIRIACPDKSSVITAIETASNIGIQQLQALGASGRRYIEESRSWERIAHLTSDLYKKLWDQDTEGVRASLLAARPPK